MAKKRRKKKSELSGISAALSPTKVSGEIKPKQLGMGLVALAAGNIVGSIVFGKHSLIPSVVVGGIGIAKKNLYLTMAGAGMFLANGYQGTTPPATTTNGVEDDEMSGFDFKTFTDQAKERAKNYLSNFAEKLYLPKPKTAEAVNGLNGDGDKVNYFVNPYNPNKQIDMSELDNLSTQIADRNKPVNGTMGEAETETEERNF